MCTGGHLNRSGRWICRSPIDSGPRGRSILTTAEYAGYGNSSGKVQFIVVIKDDIGESRLAFDAMATSTTVNGTMTYQAAVGLQSGVLTMRNRSLGATDASIMNKMFLETSGERKTYCSHRHRQFLFPAKPAYIKGRPRRRPSFPRVPGRSMALKPYAM